MRILFVFASSLLLGACSMFGYNAGVKEPLYKMLMKDGDYELREYPQIIMVTAYAEGEFEHSQDQLFQKLFDYISGKNKSEKEISMTAPVLMEGKGQNIPMTAPVLMEGQDKGWTMSFVLPETFTLKTAPHPLDQSLKLEERKNVKYAALRFSGLFRENSFTQRSDDLSKWIIKNNLKAIGPAMRAGYNPPWTLPPLRRNEVLIPVE